MDIEELKQRLIDNDGTTVTRCKEVMLYKVLDFVIGDRSEYSTGRIQTSAVAVPLDDPEVLNEGTIHAPSPTKSHALDMAGCKEEIADGVSVAVIDYVLHVYLSEGVPVGTVAEIVDAIVETEGVAPRTEIKRRL